MFKKFLLSLLACLSIFSVNAVEFTNEQLRSTGVVEYPVPGPNGLLYIDWKRQPGEAQFVIFDFKTNDYFTKFPNDHIYVLLDASFNHFPNPNIYYAGRGIILGNAGTCSGITFENYSNQKLKDCHPVTFVPNKIYTVMAHVTEYGVISLLFDYSFAGPNLIHTGYTNFPDETPNFKTSLIVIGATHDLTPNVKGVTSSIQFSNFYWGRYKY